MTEKHCTPLLRTILLLLIIATMVGIYAFSAENGEHSGATSAGVTEWVLSVLHPDLEELPPAEQEEIVESSETLIRKLAHMTEFGLLGLLVLLFAATWEDPYLTLKYLLSLAFVFFYAATDELHQTFVPARVGCLTDVLIDLAGAIFTCTAALSFLLHKQKRRATTALRKDR